MECVSIGVGCIVLLLIVFWLVQFIHMMRLPDGAFPGRYDKVLWLVTFLVASFLAPLAFWLSGVARRRYPAAYESPEEPEDGEEEEPSEVDVAGPP
jgi:hypothetical protein